MYLDFSNIDKKRVGLKVDVSLDDDGDLCIFINGKIAACLMPDGLFSARRSLLEDPQDIQIDLESFK